MVEVKKYFNHRETPTEDGLAPLKLCLDFKWVATIRKENGSRLL
jgi:hypothetical protein